MTALEMLEACEEWLYQNDLLSKGMGQLLATFVQPIVESNEQAAYERGANWMLDAVRASLKGYPGHGGDIVVMQEVERIEKAARLDEMHQVRYTYHHAEDWERTIVIVKYMDKRVGDLERSAEPKEPQ